MAYSYIINHSKHNLGANLSIRSKALELRKRMTQQERILWNSIRGKKINGMYFRRQHPYGIYILDFYCFEQNLVIEIDGMIHLGHHDYDIERTEYLISSGLKVLRFRNEDVEDRIQWVIQKIIESTIISPLGETGKGVKK
jgi:very-short-patch-repair endonuclease